MFNKKIPVHIPIVEKDDINAVYQTLNKKDVSGSSSVVKKFENNFSKWLGVKYAIAVSSGTAALFLAARAIGLKKNDHVLVSSITNIATSLAVYHNEAITIPVDVEKRTWNLDISLIEKLITKKTKIIMPVHFLGQPVDMDKLCFIAKKHNFKIIEDCAESHGATWNNKKTGAFGDISCFSFYSNKIISCGEGGMVATNNKKYAEKVRLLRNLAFKIPRFVHDIPGFNFRLSGIQAAMGISQLKKINRVINEKIKISKIYEKYLKNIPGITTPLKVNKGKHVYWMYGITVDEKKYGSSRDQLASYLKKKNIETRTFFCPLNKQPFLRKHNKLSRAKCPNGETLWRTGIYLPSSNSLKESTIKKICSIIQDFKK